MFLSEKDPGLRNKIHIILSIKRPFMKNTNTNTKFGTKVSICPKCNKEITTEKKL